MTIDTTALVRFNAVTKSYDGVHPVVRNLDLEVREGEFLSLLGPSGCGKTTILMMLAGFERPTAGAISLRGQPIDHVPTWRRNIGVVFQSYALFPHLTVAENIAFPLYRRGWPSSEISARVNSMLLLVQLEAQAKRRPAQLSGGQQQRVALARALVFDPALVLLDEPLGALDKRLREQLQLELKRLHARIGVTMLYVTHDQSEALAMSDRIAVLMQGRLRQVATPTELYEHPADAAVAEFVGENNRLQGTIESVHSGSCILRLANGDRIYAATSPALVPGATAVLSLRPERMLLATEFIPTDYDNRLSAHVSDIVYLGDHARLELMAGGQTLLAKVPNDARQPIPRLGASVVAAWRSSDCRIFSDQDVVSSTRETS